jgi:L-fuconolactonase
MSAQTEEALEPDIVICDSHHHLYMPGSMFHGPYSVSDLRRDIDGHNVTKTVYVETQSAYRTSGSPLPLAPVGETEWVVSQWAEDQLVQGIVGFADLMLGDAVEDVLDAHLGAAAGLFRGVRFRDSNFNQPPPPADWCRNKTFHAGVAALQRRNLVLEIFVLCQDLAEVGYLARSCPDVLVVVDHVGAPTLPSRNPRPHAESTREEMLGRWRRDLADLARCENVIMKVGGIGMSFVTDPSALEGEVTSQAIAKYWGPLLLEVIELFGPARSMFESNFPIDLALCDYVTLWNAYKLVSKRFNQQERESLFHDTAARVYQLS